MGSRPAPPPRRAGELRGASPGPGEGGDRVCAAGRGLSVPPSPPCVHPPPPPHPRVSSSPRGGEGSPRGAAGSRRGFEVPAAAARAPRGGGAWRAARMLRVSSARSARPVRAGHGGGPRGAAVSAHAPRRPSPPRGSPPTRDPPRSGAGLCLPRVLAAWGPVGSVLP